MSNYKCIENPACEIRGGVEVHSFECFRLNGKKWEKNAES